MHAHASCILHSYPCRSAGAGNDVKLLRHALERLSGCAGNQQM